MATPPLPPIPAATVIVLRDGRAGFETLMVLRPEGGAFGGMVVFPGGKIDPVDTSELAGKVVVSSHDDRAFRSAVLRELAEETGLLLTSEGLVDSPDLRGADLFRMLERRGTIIAGDSLVLISRWVTPEIARRRFDTRFYLLEATDDPVVRLDESELEGYAWVTPSGALDRYEEGAWPMILPTLAHLRWLSRRSSIAEAITSAAGADGRTLIRPRVMDDGSLLPIHLPADQM